MKTSEWTSALRSGQFGQGQNCLNDGEGNFCCLGVLCEVAEIPRSGSVFNLVEYLFPVPSHQYASDLASIASADAQLPFFVQDTILEDLNLQSKVPLSSFELTSGDNISLQKQTVHDRLMSLNDSGASFEFIADYIEKVRDEQNQ